jgi:hypothetical protein
MPRIHHSQGREMENVGTLLGRLKAAAGMPS